MKKESFAFLIGGFAFGVLLGYALFDAIHTRPALDAASTSGGIASPAGPMAPTQVGSGAQAAGGGGPMVAEINALKRAVQENPRDLPALMRLANLYHEVSMFEQALQFYTMALQVAPDNPDLLTDTGVAFKELGQYDRALDHFRRAQEVDPTHWQCLFNTVVVAGLDLGRFDLADVAMERLEGMQPTPPQLAGLRRELAKARSRRGGPGG